MAAQVRLLPEPLFEQQVAVAEAPAVRVVERTLLQRVIRLQRRFNSDLVTFRNVRKLIQRYSPQLVVCWDIEATEQLRLALLGMRVSVPVVLLLNTAITDRARQRKLRANYLGLGLHVLAGSEFLVRHLDQQGLHDRVSRLAPFTGSRGVDKTAVRTQMGLPAAGPIVFLSSSASPADRLLGMWGCAIVQRLLSELTLVMTSQGQSEQSMYRYQRFDECMPIRPILFVCDSWDEHLAVSAADVYLEPTRRAGEVLGCFSAFAQRVPVVASVRAQASLDDPGGERVCPIQGTGARRIAASVLNVLEDHTLCTELAQRASDWSEANGSELAYRSALVRLYQNILEQHWRPGG
jgi:hypothetical protein